MTIRRYSIVGELIVVGLSIAAGFVAGLIPAGITFVVGTLYGLARCAQMRAPDHNKSQEP